MVKMVAKLQLALGPGFSDVKEAHTSARAVVGYKHAWNRSMHVLSFK
jgi:hypothetical protein